jgi:hypothetical protein
MAIYKGRSVQIIATAPVTEPNITIAHKDGSTSIVKPSELLFTKIEMDRIQKDNSTRYTFDDKHPNGNYRLINDKDHQEIVDGQDPVKMEAKVKNQPNAHEVTIPAQTIKVNPNVPVARTVTPVSR